MSEQAIAVPTWADVINETKNDFIAIAETHKAVQWREECEFALQAVNKNLKLSQCTPYTIQSAIKNVASVGLSLNPAYAFAYLVPEAKKSGSEWVQECQLRISFQGLIKLATDSGSIKVVKAEIVRENDVFEYKGPMTEPKHTISTPFKPSERGNPIGVYCIAITNEDRPLVDLMPWDEVLKIKSKAKTQTVWDTWTEEMAKKAIIKRASKQWPKTDQYNRLQNAVAVSNETEGSSENDYTDEQYEKYHAYLANGTAIEFSGYSRSLPEETYNALYNSFEKGDKSAGKARASKKEQEGSKLILKASHDVNSDDEETKETALDGMTDLEKKIIIKYAQS